METGSLPWSRDPPTEVPCALFLRWWVVSPSTNPEARVLPFVRCPWLLIQYIRSCSVCPKAVSSTRDPRMLQATVTRDPHNMAYKYIYTQIPSDVQKVK